MRDNYKIRISRIWIKIWPLTLLFVIFFFQKAGADFQKNSENKKKNIVELYQLSKSKDPILKRLEARLEAAKAEKDMAFSAFMPKITANGSARNLWHEVHNYPQKVEGDYTGYSYGIGSAVPLINMSSIYLYTSADAGIDSAKCALKSAHQDLIIRLLDSYLKYIKSKNDLKIYRDERDRVEKILKQNEAFYKKGTGDIIAVFEGKARLDSASADIVKAEAQLEIAKQNLISLSGIEFDDLEDIQDLKESGPQPADVESWLVTMMQKNLRILKSEKDLAQAEEDRKAAKAGHFPTLQGNFGYTVDKGSTFLPEVETRQWYAGVSMSIPIYSGGDTSARTRRAFAIESEYRSELYDTKIQSIKKLKEAFYNLSYTYSLVISYRRKLESSELQLKAIRKGSDIGTRTAVDLLNAEQSHSVSVRDLTAALHDNVLKQFELKATAGVLSEDDLEVLSKPYETIAK